MGVVFIGKGVFVVSKCIGKIRLKRYKLEEFSSRKVFL